MEGNGQSRTWGYAQEQSDAMVGSAVQALRREGIAWQELSAAKNGTADHWARALAECVSRGDCQAGVLFCHNPGLVCCVANKIAGVRAVPVATVAQAQRALVSLGANLLAVEMPGRTFFEIRQILRLVCSPNGGCPEGVACTLQELDGRAHR